MVLMQRFCLGVFGGVERIGWLGILFYMISVYSNGWNGGLLVVWLGVCFWEIVGFGGFVCLVLGW